MYLTYSSVPYRMVYPTNKTKTMMSITDCMKLICSIEYAILTVDSLECICIYIYIYMAAYGVRTSSNCCFAVL